MSGDPWTDPDPDPEDFDAAIDAGEVEVEHFPADPTRQLVVEVAVPALEAARLDELAAERHQAPSDVLAELIRSA